MDVFEFDSSDEAIDVEGQSNQGTKESTDNRSADQDHATRKSKLIRKHYEPIRDGNVFIRYEDDPSEYKRLRKKIQNRESAARVRGRKKGTMEGLEVEVEDLKKVNSQLMLKNASLQTQNNSLKNEVEFLRSIIQSKTNQVGHTQDTDQYTGNTENVKVSGDHSEYQSPFQEDSAMQWVRESYSSGARSNWGVLFVATIVICVFVLPSEGGNEGIIAQQTHSSAAKSVSYFSSQLIAGYGKQILKYLLLGLYVFFVAAFLYSRYGRKKSKKI